MRVRAWSPLAIACAAFAVACGAPPPAAAPDGHDAPIPKGEARATLAIVVDLPVASDCEERFDLAIYQDPGVELVEWRPGGGTCVGRRATIRYVPGRVARGTLEGEIRAHAVRASIQ